MCLSTTVTVLDIRIETVDRLHSLEKSNELYFIWYFRL